MKRIETMRINRGYLEIIDQRKLPSKAERIKLRGYKEVADAIKLHGCLARVGEAIERNRGLKIGELKEVVYGSVWEILEEDLKCGEAIGGVGEILIGDGYEVMTHCNAGVLATSGKWS